ncbi:MAG: di-trans,poly-cis-decaprenylcistransferase [Chlamydiae bacterium]|nr:di-trans,poly-cis-decaprenylcistransferase [Chlamydiota bacterium]
MVTLHSPYQSRTLKGSPFELLDLKNIPEHIAIIMDGNRRWAKKNNLPAMMGHWEGSECLTNIVKACIELKVKVLTVFAFSTENWTRSSKEISMLMHLFDAYLAYQCRFLQKEGVRLDTIGDISALSPKVQNSLYQTKTKTAEGKKLDLVIAINYGSRDEIRRAMLKMLKDYDEKKISKENFTEDLFSKYLDTAKWRDPELVIRTSGEQRLSNFLLWQSSYSEFYATSTLWPDFTKELFYEAILEYQRRKRRLGGS